MFTKEQTIIRPAFGKTLEEVIQLVDNWNQENYTHHQGYLLGEMFACEDAIDLINCNSHAIKILEQCPHYIVPESLRRNYSEESIYLDRKYNLGDYRHKLTWVLQPNIDTYLTEDVNIVEDPFYFEHLCKNPYAIPYIKKHLDKLEDWCVLSSNPEALDILEEFPEKIIYNQLCKNPNPRAIAILRDNLKKVYWEVLSENTCDEAIDLLIEYPHLIDYYKFSENTNSKALMFLKENPTKPTTALQESDNSPVSKTEEKRLMDYYSLCKRNEINYYNLSRNPNPIAIDILKEHPEKIKWSSLSLNESKEAVELLRQNPDKIDWSLLCNYGKTKEQFKLIRENIDKIDWEVICRNSCEEAVKLLEEHPDRIQWWNSLYWQNVFETIATYDYAGIRGYRHDLHQEFHAWAGHPIRMVTKWRDWGFDNYGMDEEDDTC
jgi:hypothetical protein